MSSTSHTASVTALPRDADPDSNTILARLDSIREWLAETYSQQTAEHTTRLLWLWGNRGHQSPYTAPIWEYAADETDTDPPDTEAVQSSYTDWVENDIFHQPHPDPEQTAVRPDDPDELRDAIAAVSELSRDVLREHYGDRFRIHRGIDNSVWSDHVEMLETGEIRVAPPAMESWTLDKDVAADRAAYTLSRTIPVEDVLFYGDLFMSQAPWFREIAVGGYEPYRIPADDVLWS